MTLVQEGGIAKQIFHLPFESSRLVSTPERVNIGSTATEVFQEILRLNPYIIDVSVVFYQPGGDSHTGVLTQSPVWFPKGIANVEFLKEISNLNYKNSGKKDIMAICSRVRLVGGEFMQIPMMDFSIPKSEVSLKDDDDVYITGVSDLAGLFNSVKGALLATDKSFHFWSPSLMTNAEWDNFMEDRLVAENRRAHTPIYDVGFLEDSIERRFSALRIFSYPEVGKEETPTVVALAK